MARALTALLSGFLPHTWLLGPWAVKSKDQAPGASWEPGRLAQFSLDILALRQNSKSKSSDRRKESNTEWKKACFEFRMGNP